MDIDNFGHIIIWIGYTIILIHCFFNMSQT